MVQGIGGDDDDDDGLRPLRVAVLGSSELDATTVDLASITLAGVPASSAFVTDEFSLGCGHGHSNCRRCTYKRQDLSDACTNSCIKTDGFQDVILTFNLRDVLNAIGPVPSGQVTQVTLSGLLTSDIRIQGSDCLIIQERGGRHVAENALGGSEFSLGPNVPNPFNPITRISYYVPKEAFVTVSIHDVSGRFLEQLVSGVRPAGEHEVRWDAKGHASGIYFYSLEAGDFVQTRKMILLK